MMLSEDCCGRFATISFSLAVWLGFKNSVRWWVFETGCQESLALSRMAKAAQDSFRWRQHMLPLHPWQEKFKQPWPQRHSSSPFKVTSQLSRGEQSDLSIVHRQGEPLKMVKRKQFANKAFPKITSTNWKAQRSENRVLGGIPNISSPRSLLIISSHAVKNWFYLTKI